MKLFLISQEVNNNYDTYDSAVVAAPDEATAQNMHPSNGKQIGWATLPKYDDDWCKLPEQVTVKYLGETDLPQGVVCASFNAG